MARTRTFIIGVSSALIMAVGAAKYLRSSSSPDAGAPATSAHLARTQTAPGESSGSWMAKPDGRTDTRATGGWFAHEGPSAEADEEHGLEPRGAASSTGRIPGATTSDVRRRGGSLETGAATGDTITSRASVPGALPPGAENAARSGGAQTQSGHSEGLMQDTRTQGAVLGGDPSKTSNNPEDQGPVLSLPFENSTVPETGEAPLTEEGIAFDGHGATFSTDAQLAIPNAGNLGDAEQGTISFCLQPQWSGGENTDASLVNLHTNTFENRLHIAKNGQYLRLLLADNTGHESGASLTISGWQPGEHHLVTATWGQALASLYVDGQLVGANTYQGELQIPPGTPMYIGSDVPGGNPGARGSLSNFQVYNRVLGPDEVAGFAPNCQ